MKRHTGSSGSNRLSALIAGIAIATAIGAWSNHSALAQVGAESAAQHNEREHQMFELLKQAQGLIADKQYVEARKILLEAVPLEPSSNSGNLHAMMALVDQQLGNLEESIRENELAMKYKPEMVDLRWNIALAYKDLGDYEKSKEWINLYLSSDAQDPKRRQEATDMLKKLAEQAQLGTLQNPRAPDYLGALIAEQGAARWPRENMPLKIFIEPADRVPGAPPDDRDLILAAFESWNRASGGAIAMQLVDKPKRADILVRWTDKPGKVTAHDGVHLEQGVTRVTRALIPGAQVGIIRKADITLLTVSRETGQPLTPDALKEVCLHEAGHALGLGGHSANSADTMYFSTSVRQLPALSFRDKNTISILYNGSVPMPMQQGRGILPAYGRQPFMPPQYGVQPYPGFAPANSFARSPSGQLPGAYQMPQQGYGPTPYQQQQPQYMPNSFPPQRPMPYMQNPYQQSQQPYVQNQYPQR